MVIDQVVLVDEIEVHAEFNGMVAKSGVTVPEMVEAATYLRDVQTRRAWQAWVRG